ncbi:type IV pilin-like G/H family protein [Pseudanabaena sp. 'Roaring Creek']|uniref:type IV pilin-like G/H family protein n=1 Tax=Pseudanabaena sp. 'Roaring Creek' TaxID=1681830 RepID=UPI0006D7D260|nr:type IV pilin-like G/H family protein [Pseudanabaena sp. 'Roaring Creek']
MDFKNLVYIVSLLLRDRQTKIQNLNGKGFTLIEMLVTMIIIGILAAIAIPSFLNQANKARFAEAKSYVGTMSRLQQAYYLEKKTFAGSISQLSFGANTSSSSFTYSVMTGDVNGNASPVQLDQIVTNIASPLSPNLQAFVGVVGIPGVVRIDAVFCIANFSGVAINPGALDSSAQTMKCPINFTAQ